MDLEYYLLLRLSCNKLEKDLLFIRTYTVVVKSRGGFICR